MNTSELFLNNITVIDHAVIGDDGRQHGGSYQASFRVKGSVDPVEQVVIDFSAVKKRIKEAIDHRDIGFDHKLWYIRGWSDADVTLTDQGNKVRIVSSAMEIEAPSNILRTIDSGGRDFSIALMEEKIAEFVQAELDAVYAAVNVEVQCTLTEVGFTMSPKHRYFRYSHGLRNSTSWGCQNIAHGHLSWMEFAHDEHYRDDCQDCQDGVASLIAALSAEWDGAVLIDEANVVANNDDHIAISYDTPRGHFYAKYRKPYVKTKVLPHETTVEHIVEAFARENAFWLERAHVKSLFISEGLAKGAVKEFRHD